MYSHIFHLFCFNLTNADNYLLFTFIFRKTSVSMQSFTLSCIFI
nr:MAG TPA: protein of unknown function (DUF4717) [Caudoviricetes sp.]